MPATALLTHPVCLEHDTGPGHPERAERLKAVLEALSAPEFHVLHRHEAPPATREHLLRVHPPSHVERVLGSVPEEGYASLDPDTQVSPHSGEAAMRAAGAVTAAVDGILAKRFARAFCAIRPPGHHAEPERAMGFCLFNNVAVGAAHALAKGLKRVAIVDFDVHHGNGTQAWGWDKRNVLFCSTHQFPLYPGTGIAKDMGEYETIVNVPLGAGAGSAEFRAAYQWRVLPALEKFKPEMIFVSAGFDAHKADPLAGLELNTDDYAWITTELAAVAAKHAQGRIVSTLEGGYELKSLAESVAAHVRVLTA